MVKDEGRCVDCLILPPGHRDRSPNRSRGTHPDAVWRPLSIQPGSPRWPVDLCTSRSGFETTVVPGHQPATTAQPCGATVPPDPAG